MNSKPAGKLDPRTFDLDGWITGIKSVTKTVPLYQRADLIDEMRQLRLEIDRQEIAERNEDVGIGDRDPRHELIERHNALVAEFEASRVDFVFRPYRADDRSASIQAMMADGLPQPGKDAAEEVVEAYESEATLHMTARCAIEPTMTVDQARAIRSAFGEFQYQFLVAAWSQASLEVQGDVAPLSLPLSRTHTDDER